MHSPDPTGFPNALTKLFTPSPRSSLRPDPNHKPTHPNHAPKHPNRTPTMQFVEVLNRNHVRMVVWERGAGRTLACGTGACATVVAGVLEGKVDRNCQVSRGTGGFGTGGLPISRWWGASLAS